jgi:nucleotide-binding universal stress UspA family protein
MSEKLPLQSFGAARMERKLLITVGDDPDFLYGVRFVSTFFRNKKGIKLTLLHVAPRFESMDAGEASEIHEMDRVLSEIYARKGQAAIERSREILRSADFAAHQISSRLIPKHYGMIGDLVQEAKQGSYDAVVLGRRGYSILEKSFHSWLSEATMDLDIDFPLWICRRPERGLKNVLLCVDGSEPSLKMADHVRLMLENDDQHQITLLHVDSGIRQDVEALLDAARARLVGGGIQEQRVRTLVLHGRDAAKTIQGEAGRGAYAVVAVGRRGVGYAERSQRPFMGSQSLELLKILEKSTLWVSR